MQPEKLEKWASLAARWPRRRRERQAETKLTGDAEAIRNVTDSLDGLWLPGRPPPVDPH